jgi:hypothetical protein
MFTKIVIQLKMKKKIKLSARRMPFVRTRTAAAHATSTIANPTPPHVVLYQGFRVLHALAELRWFCLLNERT